MPDINMPATFPVADFSGFALAARSLFPEYLSIEDLDDKQERLRQFMWSWQAVRYRYRSCFEYNGEFKELLKAASDIFKAGWSDEELLYKLERCIYVFFTSALSVFDSFAFCLYFYGNAVQPQDFPLILTPKKIDRKITGKAFEAAFPSTSITGRVVSLQSDSKLTTNDARFIDIDKIRNLVGHRLSGRRKVLGWGTTHEDGSRTHLREETLHIPGLTQPLVFDDEMLQRQLDNITDLVADLSLAAREFAEQHQPAPGHP